MPTTTLTYGTDPATFGPWHPRFDECSRCERSTTYAAECTACAELVCDDCATSGPMESDTGWSDIYCSDDCAELWYDDERDDERYY